MCSSLYHANNQGQGRHYTIAIEYNRSSKMRMPVFDIIEIPSHTLTFFRNFFLRISLQYGFFLHTPFHRLILFLYYSMSICYAFSRFQFLLVGGHSLF